MFSKLKKALMESVFWCRGDRLLNEHDLQKIYFIQLIQGIAIALLALANIVSGLLSLASY